MSLNYKIQITRHVFSYVFQILVFQLLDNSEQCQP